MRVAGWVVLAVWVPVLVAGVLSLRSRGRLGRSDTLIVKGVYEYVRHPLYCGTLDDARGPRSRPRHVPVVVAGFGWLLVTQAWSIHEERELARRFGAAYAEYRQSTNRIVPDVGSFLRSGFPRVRTTLRRRW